MDAHRHTVPSRATRGHLVMSEAELIAWGERLGADSHPQLVIALSGELGAGKTTLAQAICRGYGVVEPVTSPTYAIVHEYVSPHSPVYHIDLYRIERVDELDQLGWSDIIASNALVIVEWPERAGDMLPADHLPIVLDYDPERSDRRLLLAG